MKNLKISSTAFFCLATLIISFLAVRFLFTPQGFTFHDETQIANLHQYFRAIDAGQFPPRWASDVHFGFGSPLLQFNYQLPYYLGYFFHLLDIDIVLIFKMLLGISVLIGALGVYFLGLRLSSPLPAFIAATLYTYTPYHAVDIFVRGTLGEAYALSLFPWLFLAYFNLYQKPNFLNSSICAGFLALFLITHQIAFIFSLFLLIIIFVLPSILKFDLKKNLYMIGSFIFALCISAYYWLPILTEKRFLRDNSPFNFYDHFPFIKQLIYSPWGYNASVPGIYDGLSLQIGLPNLLILVLSALSLIWIILKRRFPNIIFTLSFFTALFSIFLMNIRSSFLWERFPLTSEVQFPWRLLLVTTWLTPILYLFISKALSKPIQIVLSLIIGLGSFIIVLPYYHPGELADHYESYYLRRFLPTEVLLPGETISADYLKHVEDYVPLPKTANRPSKMLTSRLTSINNSPIVVLKNEPFNFEAEVSPTTEDRFTFSSFVYPGWQVRVNGVRQEIVLGENGAVAFDLKSGKQKIEIFFTDSPIRRWSNIISLGALIFFFQYLIYYLSQKRETRYHSFSRSK